MTALLPRAPIASLEAEESVTGGCLVHPRAHAEASLACVPGDFYYPAPRAVFEAMGELAGASKPIDAVTVLAQLQASDTLRFLRQEGGAAYLTHLMASVVTTENIGYHARIIATKARRRRVTEKLRELAAAGQDEASDDEAYMAEVERSMTEIRRGAPDSGALVPIKEVAGQWLDRYKLLAADADDGRVVRYVPTGVAQFDGGTGGLMPGEILTIAARPARGKTSMMNFILAACGIEGVPALCISYEMATLALFGRTISAEAHVDGQRLRVPRGDTKAMIRVMSAVGRAVSWPITFLNRPDMTVDKLRGHARRWRQQKGCDGERALIAVDYAQIVKAGLVGKGVSREREVAHVATEIDAMALELGVAVAMLAQLNRETAKRGRPKLEDIRESGQIEAVSDVVWGIHMPELDEAEDDPNAQRPAKTVAWLVGLKGRSVSGGSIRMMYEPPYTRFSNPEER